MDARRESQGVLHQSSGRWNPDANRFPPKPTVENTGTHVRFTVPKSSIAKTVKFYGKDYRKYGSNDWHMACIHEESVQTSSLLH